MYTSNIRNATSMQVICVAYSCGSTQNSWKKSRRPSTSTGTQNTTTVAIAMRMLAPHDDRRSCFLNMNMLPSRQPAATMLVTGWRSPRKLLS